MNDEALSRHIRRHVAAALAEDVGKGDITAGLLDPATRVSATIMSRESAVLCGSPWVDEVFRQLDPGIRLQWHTKEGDPIGKDDLICTIEGLARPVMTGERTALNYLQTLSGTASLARRYADAVDGTSCRVLDTRKTLPGLRLAQKYAVRCGGCHNHRTGLYDGLLIKENHILALGSVAAAVSAARSEAAGFPVEVEVEDLGQLKEALEAGADIILLDNFTLEETRAAVSETAGRAMLEASGNIEFEKVREVALTGVDYVSVGALTKNVRATDLSMRVEFTEE